MAESPYVPFYPSDWLAGTRGLTAVETGVYITLVAMMYEREGPLDMDEARLARLCGASAPAFARALDGLIAEGKITRGAGGLYNKRVAAELKKRAEKRECARDSAKGRWRKTQSKQGPSDANALRKRCETDANQNQNQSIDTDVSISRPKRRTQDDPAFTLFWAAYPRKVAKGAARKAWAKAVRIADPPVIVAAAQAVEDRGEYTPHPATWLNAERWADAPETRHVADEPAAPPRHRHALGFDAAVRYARRHGAGGDPQGEGGDDGGGDDVDRGPGGGAVVPFLDARRA